MTTPVVIGIDGGGSHTRVLVCDLEGRQLAYLNNPCAASIYKDSNAVHNVRNSIAGALEIAGVRPEDVRCVAAGIAGYDKPEDLAWVSELTALPGLHCRKLHVNDAVAAHAGALRAKPGIVAISGTGSIILGINELQEQIRNYDFHHYSFSAARFLAYDAIYEVLAGHAGASDKALVQSMLRHWDATDLQKLAVIGRQGFHSDSMERDKLFGQFAPIVTEAAEGGSAIAIAVCDRAVRQLKVGIEMIGSFFESDTVAVAYTGSVISSAYVSRLLSEGLTQSSNKQYFPVKSGLSPVAGAVLLAYQELGLPAPEDTLLDVS
ncbi:N-acetylglucosamine kinase [Paenibacillus paeoniae]|uniref:ATPase n=1 Tax=Paenibacillus paeoniae TaxID=2292705 RepID=A0A371P789_9BACL|nr:BadF/BadG/BcrA/BcrD ATPase family protein [Paenibacillus paeoniae]REK71801.1 ATPase [Paenibacillus paeoniae]